MVRSRYIEISRKQNFSNFINKNTWAGRNYIDNRVKFSEFKTTEEINVKMIEIVDIVKNEKFPPMDKSKVIQLMKKK